MNEAFSDPGTTFSTFVELLRWRSSHQPDRRTYTFLAGAETEEARLSYEELDQKARKIACLLQGMGAAGERALLFYPPGLEYVAALYGCLYAGVVAVPAYPPRLNKSVSRLSAIVDDAQATLALTTTPILSKVERRMANVPGLGSLRWLATDDLEDDLVTGWRDPAASSDTLAILQYTSGSTSAPKGVMLTHGNLLHQSGVLQLTLELSPRTRGLIWVPPFHDMGLFTGLLQPLYTDFPVMLVPPLAFVQNPLMWLEAISRHRVTFSGGPDFAYALCAQKIPPEQRKTLDLSSWGLAFNGAEPINVATLEQFEAAFGSCGFRREAFYPAYGLAEASLLVSGGKKAAPPIILSVQKKELENNLARKAHQEDRGSQRLVGCGEAARGQRLVIADPQSLMECRPNQVGEIWVSGPSVARGYWNRPEATRRDFSAYLAGTEEGPFLRTGDLGFVDDGELFVTGRLKDLLIIRGRNYYPQDIESVADQSHPMLRPKHSAAFTAHFEGEEQLVVVCEVERRYRKSLDADEAIRKIRRAVAEQYELQTHAVILARTGGVPKTSSGKIRRRTCKEMFLSGSLETLRTDILEVHDLASKEDGLYRGVPTEAAVADIWAEVLDLERGDVRRDDDFFDIGGHSLAAAQVTTLINQRFGVELLPRALFDAPTIAGVVRAVEQAQAEAAQQPGLGSSADTLSSSDKSILALPRHSEGGQPVVYPLSSTQRQVWHSESYESGFARLGPVTTTVRLRGPLDVAALEASLHEVCVRHEALRMTFEEREGEPVQIVGPPRPVPLTRVDLRELPPTARKAAVRRFVLWERDWPLDLSRAVMLRAVLLWLDDEEHVLLLMMHHLVSDGLSAGVLLRELWALYEASRTGEPANLPELPVQFADYVVWQQQQLEGGTLQRQLEYWKKQLAGARPTMNLPTNCERLPEDWWFAGSRYEEMPVPAGLEQELRALCRRQNTTLFMALLATWVTLLHRYSGQDNILLFTLFANRNRAEISELIGYFANVLVLRNDLAEDPSFTELLGQVRETALDGWSNGDLPFEALREALHPQLSTQFGIYFQFFENNRFNLKLDGLQIEQINLNENGGYPLLYVTMTDGDDGLKARLDYGIALFKPTTITRMLGDYLTLLKSIVADPEQRVSKLPLTNAGVAKWLAERDVQVDSSMMYD